METIITYFSEHAFIDILSAMAVIVVIVVCIEKAIKWLWDIFSKAYNKRRGKEVSEDTLKNNTLEIKKMSQAIENLGTLLNKQYQHLDKKIEEQRERLSSIELDGKNRDCAILRDRILQSTKYFSQNHEDENGEVHISLTEWENINAMFKEYFKANGNGAVKKIYEEEFSKWTIDN